MNISPRFLFFIVIIAGTITFFFLAQRNPGYFSDINYLGAILLTEIVIASIWHYEQIFFLVLILSFLWAGMDVPYYPVWLSVRWFVLAAGAFAGYVKWMKGRRQHFGAFHLTALFCVLGALVSAMVSAFPQMALLKVLSLFLLFLYASSGGRLAILGRETQFINGLVLGCEITVYISVVCYFTFHQAIFGNPNSLGLVMAIVVLPVLLWAVVVAQTRFLRHRRALALFLGGLLLYYSLSRAAMVAAAASAIILCICLRRQKLLVQAAFLVVFFLGIAGVLFPAHFDEFRSAVTSSVVYKGKEPQGVFGSRTTPWQQTVDIIQAHPWFGSGFGTSELRSASSNVSLSSVHTKEEAGREHGSSYLAITEWVGLLGNIPFLLLLFLLAQAIARVCAWMRQTASPHHCSVPLAMVLSAGLVHAFFEDWLFAVGYYLTVLFWSFAFVLIDVAPARSRETVRAVRSWHPSVIGPAPETIAIHR